MMVWRQPVLTFSVGIVILVTSFSLEAMTDRFPVGAGVALAVATIGLAALSMRFTLADIWSKFRPLGAYILLWILFTNGRSVADDIGMPDRGPLAASLDRLIGLGHTPTEHLQGLLFVPGQLRMLDYSAIAIHTSYFLIPHLIALGLWLSRDRAASELFGLYVRTTALVLGLGLMLYVLVPTSPPWLQSGDYGPLDVTRVIWLVNSDTGGTDQVVYGVAADSNPIAAMPSLHTAITVLAAWIVWRASRRAGTLFWIYTALMGLSLVYLAEHFVVDVVAGVLLTVTVIFAVRRDSLRWPARVPLRLRPRTPSVT